jgi:hypothetical protein
LDAFGAQKIEVSGSEQALDGCALSVFCFVCPASLLRKQAKALYEEPSPIHLEQL